MMWLKQRNPIVKPNGMVGRASQQRVIEKKRRILRPIPGRLSAMESGVSSPGKKWRTT
jgi:hypothetical protein